MYAEGFPAFASIRRYASAAMIAAAAVATGGCVSAAEKAPPFIVKVDGTKKSCRIQVGDRDVSRYELVSIGFAEAKVRNRAVIQANGQTDTACIDSAIYMAMMAGFSERAAGDPPRRVPADFGKMPAYGDD